MTPGQSPFHAIPPHEWLADNRSGFAIWDRHPVSPGHALVVPFRHIATWWEASADEQADLLALVGGVKALLDELHHPHGYNVGFNAGAAAGQTIDHLHLHVIPRYDGDVPDPRGGVRHVIPGKGNYLAPPTRPGADADHADIGPAAELFDARQRSGRLKLELLRCLRADAFDRVDVVVSFIMRSGLDLILDHLEDAVVRGAHARVLTTDYLDVTDPDALAQLLDLQQTSGGSNDSSDLVDARRRSGRLEARVWQDPRTSFHPKAYLFWSSAGGPARGFVGSSNLSRSGIDGGVEWNLAVGRLESLRASFETLWNDPRAVPLDHRVLRDYRSRRDTARVVTVTSAVGVEIEPPRQPVAPTAVQVEALRALEQTRAEGYTAGLVVMATGLGKTWLAAFDSARPAVRRTLFVAHRDEILRQSLDVFRQVRPDSQLGLFTGDEKQPDADVVFASVQTLSRHLGDFAPDAFDYVVVDEFHHAAAATYRRTIDHFDAGFLLGLTATPERMDGAELASLCGDNVVFDCDLVDGIRRGELSPFRYVGLADRTDFEPIPWRNGRFDPDALTRAVETRARAEQALDAWRTHGGGPTLGFCCSITHADFMAAHFAAAGLRAAAVHSGPTSAPRRDSVEQLRAGGLDVLFAVDVFNEGVDVPEVRTVLLLRPTDSPVVFLQQLGRGLRRSSGTGKTHLQVVDFIGNHVSFLAKPRVLLSLGAARTPTRAEVVEAARLGAFDLPDGCSVAYELAAVDLLAALVRSRRTAATDALADYCREYGAEHGYRPSAVQALRAGLNPRAARTRHGDWFTLLADIGALAEREEAVVASCGAALRAIEREPMTKSYKMVTLRALLHDGALRTGATVTDVAATSHRLLLADPRLVADVRGAAMPDPAGCAPAAFERFWRTWPVTHLTTGNDPLYRLEDDRLVPTFVVPDGDGDTFDALVAELVEWRLAEYLLRSRSGAGDAAVRCRVSHADGRPILLLDRARHPQLPEGWTEVRANGGVLRFNFVKIAVNVAERPGEAGNALHDLLRGWFGPSAGHPGTSHAVLLTAGDHGWELRPDTVEHAAVAEAVPLFASYEVACGAAAAPAPITEAAMLPIAPGAGRVIDATRQFVAFASGSSMAGGADPIVHGDPLLFEWVRGVGRSELVGERVLVQQAAGGGVAAMLKRLEHGADGWQLASDAPGQAPIAGGSDLRIVARLLGRLDPGEIDPAAAQVGDLFARRDVPALFGLAFDQGSWGSSGHVSASRHEVLFVTLDKDPMDAGSQYADHFEGVDRLRWSSQASVGPESAKGARLLGSPGNGQLVHLFCRRRKRDRGFTYCGVVVPFAHEGSKPMAVTFRLLSPLGDEARRRLLGDA